MLVINRSDGDIDTEFYKRVVERILVEETGRDDAVLVFVDEEEISEMNERFRGMEGPTDVLTFVYDDEDLLGEIIVCPEVVERNAESFGVEPEEEMLRVVIHGALHLSGYDHEFDESRAEEMFKKQEKLLREFLRSSRSGDPDP